MATKKLSIMNVTHMTSRQNCKARLFWLLMKNMYLYIFEKLKACYTLFENLINSHELTFQLYCKSRPCVFTKVKFQLRLTSKLNDEN